MPRWLVPWMLPMAMLLGVFGGVLVGATGAGGFAVAYFLLLIAVAAFLIRMRLRYLKKNPPSPELTNKPFWRF